MCSTLNSRLNKTNNNEPNNTSDDLVQEYIKDMKDDHIMLKAFNEIQKQTVDNNKNAVDLKVNEVAAQVLAKPEFDLSGDVVNQVSKNERLIRSLLDIVSENNVPKKEIKVFEINLTNALMADEVDNHLASAAIYPIEVDYSVALKSMDNINEDLKKKTFKFSEWDPKSSNFPSDITLTNLVIVKDSPELWDLKTDNFAQELYDNISGKGFLISVHRYRLTEPEMALNKLNGKVVTEQQLVNRIAHFAKEAESVGFNVICKKTDSIGTMALLYRKILNKEPALPNNKNVVEITAETEKWFERVKELLVEKKESEDKEDHIWLIASDSSKNGIIGLINCLRLEPGGEAIRCIFDYDNIIKLPINFREKPFSDILVNDLVVNVLRDGKLGTYRHLTLPKDYDQTLSDEYFLNNGMSRDLSSLQWYSLKNMPTRTEGYDIQSRKVNFVKVNIYSAGLNFKDVMFATGLFSNIFLSIDLLTIICFVE